jgi:hypothetical protein
MAAAETARSWNGLAKMVGLIVGIESSEDIARLQSSLGSLSLPPEMLLSAAHDRDGWHLILEACERARRHLTPDQAARLDAALAN